MTGEGRISIGGFETWYRVVGDSTDPDSRKVPVLALHGGPGLPHESLEPLEALADGGRPDVSSVARLASVPCYRVGP